MKFKNVIDTTAEALGVEMYQPFRVNLIGQKPYTDKIYRITFGGIQVYYTAKEPNYDIGRDGKGWEKASSQILEDLLLGILEVA